MKKSRKSLKFLVPVLIITAGILILSGLTAMRKQPVKVEVAYTGALANVYRTHREDLAVTIYGTGTVTPRYQVNMIPQISGRVEWVSPNLVDGGSFKKGQPLLRIETKDYELAVQQAKAVLAQAEYGISLARANADIAKQEWELVTVNQEKLLGSGKHLSQEPDPLVLKQPQLLQAEAGLKSAEAALKMAELNLERTTLYAPFNCRIRNYNAAAGQIVGPNSIAANLYGVDIFEIEIGLAIDDMAWLDIPGASAEVILKTGENEFRWPGRVVRSVGAVEKIGRLALVVVQIDDPYRESEDYRPELSIGSFAAVEIKGKVLTNSIPIPRSAVRTGKTVWVSKPDSTLEIREVIIGRMTSDSAYITRGLGEDELVILTNLSGAAPGMKIRPVEED